MKRREFLLRSGSTVLGSSLFFSCNHRLKQNSITPAKMYLQKCLEILRKIQKDELPKLSYISERAAEIYKTGGKLFSRIHWSDNSEYDLWFASRGNPGFLAQLARSDTESTIKGLQKGDFYITNEINSTVQDAKKRGVYVVGISLPWFPNRFTLPDQIITSTDGITVEEAAHIVLYSHVPLEDGIISFPEYPMVPLCPGSSPVQIIYYWMLSAEIAYNLLSENIHKFVSKARDYIETIIMRIYEYEKQFEKIRKAARKMAKNIQAGGSFFIYDQTQSMVAEACNRASGLMMTQPLDIEKVQPNDNVLIAAESPNSPNDLSLIKELAKKKAYVVTIGPTFDIENKNPSLEKFSQIHLDNLSGETSGVVTINQDKPPICPAQKVSNIILHWTLSAQFISELINIGLVPYVRMGDYLVGGTEYNMAMSRFFKRRGF